MQADITDLLISIERTPEPRNIHALARRVAESDAPDWWKRSALSGLYSAMVGIAALEEEYGGDAEQPALMDVPAERTNATYTE